MQNASWPGSGRASVPRRHEPHGSGNSSAAVKVTPGLKLLRAKGFAS
jgi:hypothetical protein